MAPGEAGRKWTSAQALRAMMPKPTNRTIVAPVHFMAEGRDGRREPPFLGHEKIDGDEGQRHQQKGQRGSQRGRTCTGFSSSHRFRSTYFRRRKIQSESPATGQGEI